MYKIAVYAICKNEIHNVDEWMKNVQEADYICVLDTGSTDGTYEKLLEYQQKDPQRYIIQQKTYNPWRFDEARNDSMKLIPADASICVCTDFDERLADNWSDLVKGAWFDECILCFYMYAHDFTENGEPSRTIWYCKIHNNSKKWHWQYPLHEVLYYEDYKDKPFPQELTCVIPGPFILLKHYHRKNNGTDYLELAKLRHEENKQDETSAIYLAHECFYRGKFEECIEYIKNVLLKEYDFKTQLYLTSTYMFLGKALMILNRAEEAKDAFQKGIQADPTYRDNYLCLAQYYASLGQYEQVVTTVHECFQKSRHYWSWLEQPNTWDWIPWDLLTVGYYNIGAIDMAKFTSKIAHDMNPTDERIANNYKFFQSLTIG